MTTTRQRYALTPVLGALRARWEHKLVNRARPRIAITDGHDARAITAAIHLHEAGLIEPYVLGRGRELQRSARRAGLQPPVGLRTIDTDSAVEHPAYHAALEAALDRTLTSHQASDLLRNPVQLSTLLLRIGLVDGVVAGASQPTAEVIRAGIRLAGTADGINTVSSSFLLVLPDGSVVAYGDCAVVPEPTSEQLADVAIATATTHRELTGEEPIVAMLSYSTSGSAQHSSTDKVKVATEMVRERAPNLLVDGELQFDTAYVTDVACHKAPQSPVAGRANVFIFPNLDAGNIGYKITERLGGAQAIGPILQGLNAPLNDLSRGCSVDDIVSLAHVSALQSRAAQHAQAVHARCGLPKD